MNYLYPYHYPILLLLHHTETIMDADYSDDLELLANKPTQAVYLLHSFEQTAKGISLYVNSDKTEFMCFKQDDGNSTPNDKPLRLVSHFTYLSSNTEIDINICMRKPWTGINRLSTIWKSNLSDKIKQFFHIIAVSVLLYGCIHLDVNKALEEKAR